MASSSLINPAQDPAREERQWLPPARIARYERNKALGALLFMGIFAIWLVVSWSDPTMRFATLLLMAATVWITASSIRDELTRAKGRQVEVDGAMLRLRSPGGAEHQIDLRPLRFAAWVESPDSPDGRLVLADEAGRPLGELGEGVLADEREGRAFVGWLRARAGVDVVMRPVGVP